MPAATAAAEPLEDPPGVRAGMWGFRVLPGAPPANRVVSVLTITRAPTARSQWRFVRSIAAQTLSPSAFDQSAFERRLRRRNPVLGEAGASGPPGPLRRRKGAKPPPSYFPYRNSGNQRLMPGQMYMNTRQ